MAVRRRTAFFVVEEICWKLRLIRKPLRDLRVALHVLALVITTSSAGASNYCYRARDLPPISDPQVRGRLEERLQTIPAMKSHQVRRLTTGFAIAWEDEAECGKRLSCHHILLDIRDGAATIVFTYRGTGSINQLGTPPDEWLESLQDHYSFHSFETHDSNWVEVRMPRLTGPVWIGAVPSSGFSGQSCGFVKYR